MPSKLDGSHEPVVLSGFREITIYSNNVWRTKLLALLREVDAVLRSTKMLKVRLSLQRSKRTLSRSNARALPEMDSRVDDLNICPDQTPEFANPGRQDIPFICFGALRKLDSLHIRFYVCLRGETWLLGLMLQFCYTLFVVISTVHFIESFILVVDVYAPSWVRQIHNHRGEKGHSLLGQPCSQTKHKRITSLISIA